MGLGEATHNIKILDAAVEELKMIAGQQPVITRAKKSIAAFKLREGVPIGCSVTLRRNRMYDFLNKLINVALPRVRDFRGISGKAMDKRGNYTLGIREQIIFPEIDYDKIDRIKGLNITIVTTAKTDKEGGFLLLYIPADSYNLRIEKGNFIYETDVTVEESTTLNLLLIEIQTDTDPPITTASKDSTDFKNDNR